MWKGTVQQLWQSQATRKNVRLKNGLARSVDTRDSDLATLRTTSPPHANFICTNLHTTTNEIQNEQKFTAKMMQWWPWCHHCIIFALWSVVLSTVYFTKSRTNNRDFNCKASCHNNNRTRTTGLPAGVRYFPCQSLFGNWQSCWSHLLAERMRCQDSLVA